METQICNGCSLEKSLDEFSKAGKKKWRGKYGRKADCKACINSARALKHKSLLADGLTKRQLGKKKTKERRDGDWTKLLWLWNQPGYRTYAPNMISEEMFRRGFWPSTKPRYGKPNAESYVFNLLAERRGGLTARKYLSQILPYYLPYHPTTPLRYRSQGNEGRSVIQNIRAQGQTMAYERAIMYLVDGGKDKMWIINLLRKISVKSKPSKEKRRTIPFKYKPICQRDERLGLLVVTITAPELLMLWPLDDLCPICKTTKMILDGDRNAPDNASLDRKDTERTYETGNCGWVCYRCNDRKSDMTIEEVDSMAAWIRSAEKK